MGWNGFRAGSDRPGARSITPPSEYRGNRSHRDGIRSGATERSRRGFLRAVGGTGLLGTAPIAGCIGADAGTGGEEVTIEYIDVAGDRSEAVFEPVIEELETRHDTTIGLEFNEVPYTDLHRQLLTRLGGNDPPDIAAIDQIWMGQFIDSGALLPLDDVAEEIAFEDYLDALADPLMEGGTTYGIPVDTDVRGMYWNRDHFDAAGLDPNRPPATWSEFFDTAEALHDPPERYGSVYFVVAGRWTVSLFSAGGQVLDDDGTTPRFDDEPGRAAAGFLSDIYNEATIGPPEPPYADGDSTARNFLDGQYAMTVVEGSWLDHFAGELGYSDAELTDQFGFGPTPRPEDGSRATMSGGFAWVGFEATEHPEIVADFLAIAGSEEFSKELAIETGRLPTREPLLEDADIWDAVLYADEIRELLSVAQTRPIRHWPVVAEALDPALQEIAFGSTGPESALDAAAEQVREELSEG